MPTGMPMKGLRRNEDAMKSLSWYSKQLTQKASKFVEFYYYKDLRYSTKSFFSVSFNERFLKSL